MVIKQIFKSSNAARQSVLFVKQGCVVKYSRAVCQAGQLSSMAVCQEGLLVKQDSGQAGLFVLIVKQCC